MADQRNVLQELELALLHPAARSDAMLLDRLIADDFVEVAANGRTFGKDEVLNRLTSETGVSFSTENVAVRLLSPSVGLVTYTVTRNAEGSVVQSKRCSIWRLEQDQWRMTYHQGTVA